MKRDIAEQWAQALESGEYKQGLHYLHSEKDGEHKFCCLGVLCELALKAGVKVETRKVFKTEHVTNEHAIEYNGEVYLIPDEVQIWAGTKTRNGICNDASSLVSINDTGIPFPEIAKIILAHTDKL
jgi:hypothetical protein